MARLGQVIQQRRDNELGLTQEEVREAGGPSIATLSALENGVGKPPSRATLRKLDAALQWSPGSAERVWRGGTPDALTPAVPLTELDRTHAKYRALAQAGSVSGMVVVALTRVARVSEVAGNIAQLAAKLPPSDEADALVNAISEQLLTATDELLVAAVASEKGPGILSALEQRLARTLPNEIES
ncbi:helix-turn-helix transcriptional regulator [Rhodococcus sp. D2-41]|nr:helix-turn-helix transcriptional regulator [Rhodococcus sp. D2-41]